MKNRTILTLALILVLAAIAGGLGFAADMAGAQYNTACYMEQGGAKFVAGSGCEIEVQSGATFDLQSGATTDFSAGADLDGADLVIDADGDSILDENTDDAIRLTLGAASGTFSVLTGNAKVGNGTPTVTQDGEDLYVEGQLEVDGEAQFDGTVDVNGATTIDGGLTDIGGGSYTTANGDNDLGVAADLEVDGIAQFDGTVDVNGATTIDGGLTDIGGGSYATANGDNDLGVAGDLEVDGAADLDGTLSVAGAASLNSTLAVASTSTMAADVTVSSDATGGNAGARNQIIGMPAVKLVGLSTMTNGSTESANYLDDSPSGEWTEVDAGTNLAVSEDGSTYRVGSTSLLIAFTDVVTDDGVTGTAGAQDDLSGNESIGFWIYSDTAITAGDFNLVVDDSDGTDQTYDIGAVTADIWTWKEIDISGCDANCDTMDNINIIATGQGGQNLTAANIYLDGMWKWDADDEEALGVNLVQDGVLSVLVVATAAGSANTQSALAEQTNFVVNYQSGNDVIVTVDNESANSGIALVAYQ